MLRYIRLIGLLCFLAVLAGCGNDNNVVILKYLQGGSIQGLPISPTGVVTTFAGTAGATGTTDDTGVLARFNNPFGVTTDGANLYVSDANNNTIRKIVIATGVVTTLAGTPGVAGSADGTGTAATFSFPYGITTDGPNLYVVDNGNNTIRKIVIATGVVTTLAGTPGVTGSADGVGPAASFRVPAGITTDGTNLYVADELNHIIRKIVISTATVTTLAGTAGATGSTDGVGPAASFFNPAGITTDGTNLYVADWNNHIIRKIVISSAAVTTLAGTAGVTGSTDGTGAAALFNHPTGITTDGSNIYLTEQTNRTIRKIVIATGVVTTLAGNPAVPAGSADGTGAAALFNNPSAITTDGTSLYVADSGNSTIRMVQ